jgi:Zn/Cd-binding protein ZinT
MEELKQRIEWLEKGLKEIIDQEGYINMKMIAQFTLDGESTTADEYNKDDCMITYVNEGDDIEYKYKKVGNRIVYVD